MLSGPVGGNHRALPLLLGMTLLSLTLMPLGGDARKRSIVAALALLALPGLAGCGSGNGSNGPGSTISIVAARTSGAGGATSGLPLTIAEVVRN